MANINLLDYFIKTTSPRQKQYEAIRAIIVDKMSYPDAAKKFGYKTNSLYTIVGEAKTGKLSLFPDVQLGPKRRHTSDETQNTIIELRSVNNLSAIDIQKRLKTSNVNISVRTIERILADAGFDKLKRRTYQERGITAKNKIIPAKSENLDFDELEPFKTDCPVAGVYLLLPYIIESGIVDIVKKCKLPESSIIGSAQACLSMLILKLIGHDRLSKVDNYDQEPGFGIFAGVNVLPKPTYMCTYSCRTSEKMLLDFQKEILAKFIDSYPQLYGGEFINLDFHSIPHHGNEIEMEKIWCGAKHKSMRAANTVFAQDSKSKTLVYTRADILRKEEAEEIKKFVDYWKELKGKVSETLVFDCKLTKYSVLGELNEAKEKIKFITLRKRNAKLRLPDPCN
jgi:transposase